MGEEIKQRVSIEAEQALTALRQLSAEEQKLVLSVKADKTLYLGTDEKAAQVALEDLEQKLKANARVLRDHELYLMADRSLPYGYVVEVMATVQRAGVTNLGMITNPNPREVER
jgi:biopolymer transport protein TolR